MQIYQTRSEINKLITFDHKPIIAEIGVFECKFAKFLYETYLPEQLHLFDVFRLKEISGSGDEDGNNPKYTSGEYAYNNALEVFKDKTNVFLHEGFSQNTLPLMEDNFFDMIYVDGSHDEPDVYLDLINSYDKVKNDGWIVGHDLALITSKCMYNWDFSGVLNAVNRFCELKNLTIDGLFLDGCISFAIRKRSKP